MRVVVADTSPILYLTEIDHLDLLPRLFETVVIPAVVYEELQRPATPALTRQMIKFSPPWLKVEPVTTSSNDPLIMALDEGEKAALMLGLHLNTSLILIDERKGVAAARPKGLQTMGTIGVLNLGSKYKLIDLAGAFARLRQTNFYCPESLMTELLQQQEDT